MQDTTNESSIATQRMLMCASPRAGGPSQAPLEPLLSVRSLGRRYGGIVALDALSFDVMAGEKLAVIGPNGAGKSTLLRLIAGQDSPSHGVIELEAQAG